MSYHTLHGVEWVKNTDHILVVHSEQKKSWQLYGDEVLLWELLAQGYQGEKLITLFALILSISKTDSQNLVWKILQRWLSAGIVTAGSD